MKDTLLLNSVISCEELMNRWSVTESRLVKIISENKIKEYSVISTRINPHDNAKIFICREKPKISIFNGKMWSTRDISRSFFDVSDIDSYEKENPVITFPEDIDGPSEKCFQEDRLEYRHISVEILEREHADAVNQKNELAGYLSNAVSNIGKLQSKINKLETQLEEANRRTTEVEKRSNPGCEAANEKKLQQWKHVYFPAIHAVARQCEEEGPREGKERRQRKDIRVMLESRLSGVEVPRSVVDYTFAFLDDSLVDRTGGNT